jgi:integrase
MLGVNWGRAAPSSLGLRLRAELPASTRLHDLRHTCATLLVQHLLGYASISLTLGCYSHWTPSMGEQTSAAMESALG